MERQHANRTPFHVLRFAAFRLVLGVTSWLIYVLAPQVIGLPALVLFVGWSVTSAMSLRSGRCQYCGVRDGLPLYRNGSGVAQRKPFDLRPYRDEHVTWVCSQHFGAYLAERL